MLSCQVVDLMSWLIYHALGSHSAQSALSCETALTSKWSDAFLSKQAVHTAAFNIHQLRQMCCLGVRPSTMLLLASKEAYCSVFNAQRSTAVTHPAIPANTVDRLSWPLADASRLFEREPVEMMFPRLL